MTVEKFLDPKNDFAFKKIFGTDQYYWTEEELNTYQQETKRALDERVILEYRLATSYAEGEKKW